MNESANEPSIARSDKLAVWPRARLFVTRATLSRCSVGVNASSRYFERKRKQKEKVRDRETRSLNETEGGTIEKQFGSNSRHWPLAKKEKKTSLTL